MAVLAPVNPAARPAMAPRPPLPGRYNPYGPRPAGSGAPMVAAGSQMPAQPQQTPVRRFTSPTMVAAGSQQPATPNPGTSGSTMRAAGPNFDAYAQSVGQSSEGLWAMLARDWGRYTPDQQQQMIALGYEPGNPYSRVSTPTTPTPPTTPGVGPPVAPDRLTPPGRPPTTPTQPLTPPSRPTYPTPSSFDPTNLGRTLGSRLQYFLDQPAPYFNQSLFTGMGDTTRTGLDMLTGAADRAGGAFGDAFDYAQNLMTGGGLTPDMTRNMTGVGGIGDRYAELSRTLGQPGTIEGTYRNISDSLANPSTGQTGMEGLAGRLQGQSPAEQQYAQLAQMLGQPGQAQGQYSDILRRLQGSTAQGDFQSLAREMSGQGGAEQQYAQLASMLANPSYAESGFRQMADQSGGPSLTEQTMMGVARGDNLNRVDPAYQQMVDRRAQEMSADITGAAGMSGRGGASNLLADAIGQNVGDMRLQAANDYRQNEQARQQQALAAIEGQRQQGVGNRSDALVNAEMSRLGQLDRRFGAIGAGEQSNLGRFDRRADLTGAGNDARLSDISAMLSTIGAGDASGLGRLDRQMSSIGQSDNSRLAQIGAYGDALGSADAMRLNQLQSRLGTLGQMDASGANRFNQLLATLGGQQGALESGFGMGQTGIGNALTAGNQLGGLYGNSLLPGQTYQGVGGQIDADTQGRQMGNYDLYSRSHDADYNRMMDILGSFTSSQQNAGMQEQTPWWQTLLGTAGSIADIFL